MSADLPDANPPHRRSRPTARPGRDRPVSPRAGGPQPHLPCHRPVSPPPGRARAPWARVGGATPSSSRHRPGPGLRTFLDIRPMAIRRLPWELCADAHRKAALPRCGEPVGARIASVRTSRPHPIPDRFVYSSSSAPGTTTSPERRRSLQILPGLRAGRGVAEVLRRPDPDGTRQCVPAAATPRLPLHRPWPDAAWVGGRPEDGQSADRLGAVRRRDPERPDGVDRTPRAS